MIMSANTSCPKSKFCRHANECVDGVFRSAYACFERKAQSQYGRRPKQGEPKAKLKWKKVSGNE